MGYEFNNVVSFQRLVHGLAVNISFHGNVSELFYLSDINIVGNKTQTVRRSLRCGSVRAGSQDNY